MIFQGVMKVSFGIVLKCARWFLGLDSLLFSSGQRKYVNILGMEKATLTQQAKELQKKLEAIEECRAAVEEKLTEGAITTVEHVVRVIKSHQPDFDPSFILQGYNYSQPGDAQKLLEGIQPMLTTFVEKLSLSVDDDDEEDGE